MIEMLFGRIRLLVLTLLVIAGVALLSTVLVINRSINLLIGIIVAAGFLQAPLMALTQSPAFQYIDDIPVATIVVAATIRVVAKPKMYGNVPLLLISSLLLLVTIGIARAPDVGIGVTQARQVLLPLGLIFAGFVYKTLISWSKVCSILIFFGSLTALWAIFEELLQAPLVDPTWYYVDVIGGDSRGLREGLPPAYYADGIDADKPVFRPGGPFMNPPVMGFLLGLGAFAAMYKLRGIQRIVIIGVIGMALFFGYARAGILIFLVVTVIFYIWAKVGKHAGIIVGMVLGGYLISTFLSQGNTSSHSEGFLSGLVAGIRAPFGIGFGTTGYQAALEGASSDVGNESLLGLYFAWIGWPMVIAVIILLLRLAKMLRRLPKSDSLPVWLAIALVLTAASSESASSMASTPVLWLVTGAVIYMSARPAQGNQRPTRSLRPTESSWRSV